jgi:putative transposase
MPRQSIHRNPGHVFHVMNRATRGQLLFRDPAEFQGFQALLARALRDRAMRMLSYCLMPNHFHMALWPSAPDQISTFLQWLCATHARRLHRKRGTSGCGAVYQSRFKAVAVHNETYFYRVLRYIERNAARAELCDRADEWAWSSASAAGRGLGIVIADWPIPRPPHWLDFVNDHEPLADLDFIRTQTASGEPIGPVGFDGADRAIMD